MPLIWNLEPGGALRGRLELPGDKSISHRSLILNALSTGEAKIKGLLDSEDIECTRRALTQLGVQFRTEKHVTTVSPPSGHLCEPVDVLNCGNSGTTARLLCGVLAGSVGHSVLTGDASLLRRPMGRVVDPLRQMGADIRGREGGGRLPIAIQGQTLQPIDYVLPVASAQVKTALLIAGLKSGVRLKEPGQSRDHTERMLRDMGANLTRDRTGKLTLAPQTILQPLDMDVPGDMSAAAFWLVGASIVPGSQLHLPGVGLNPSRSGALDALLMMGADIQLNNPRVSGGEPIADIVVKHAPLRGVRIDGALALRCLDELPVLAVAAAFAHGPTTIADAAELRVKESDRIATMVNGLHSLGFQVDERPDGMTIHGGQPKHGARIEATGDHRIAMAFAIAACGGASVCLSGVESVQSSYPSFMADLEGIRG